MTDEPVALVNIRYVERGTPPMARRHPEACKHAGCYCYQEGIIIGLQRRNDEMAPIALAAEEVVRIWRTGDDDTMNDDAMTLAVDKLEELLNARR